MKKLTKDERNILFYIYQKKFMDNYKPFMIADLIDHFITEYDQNDIIEIIKSFISYGFIVVILFSKNAEAPLLPESISKIKNYRDDKIKICAPKVKMIANIESVLKYRIYGYWLKTNCIIFWRFIWKHFIVTIIVAASIASITTRFSH